MLVVAALQSNQRYEQISGSQCETLIRTAVITVRLQLWFAGFPNICRPAWRVAHMNENRHAKSRCEHDFEDVSKARAHSRTRTPHSGCTDARLCTQQSTVLWFHCVILTRRLESLHFSLLSLEHIFSLCLAKWLCIVGVEKLAKQII